jgi:hypothetical protein
VLKIDLADIGFDLPKDRLDARRLDAREAADADVALDFFDRCIDHLIPRWKASSQLPVPGGAVGGGGVLRKDRVHQHIDAAAPALPRPRAVRADQPAEDSAHPSRVGTSASCVHQCHAS